MSKSNRQAGQNVRQLALKRRVKAVTSFASAGLIISFPFVWDRTVESSLKRLSSLNSSQATLSSHLPFSVYALCFITALSLVANGIYRWKRANHADQGAKGEADTADEIAQLEREGWQIEYGMRLGNRLGDADIFCISPQGKAYVIDVKSHRGTVKTDGKQLHRRMGKATYSFEKNFLEQAMKQALQVKKQKSLSFVTPIVAFSTAKVAIPSGKVQKVYVVEGSRLLTLLQSLG
jgi:Nuclease-related domain